MPKETTYKFSGDFEIVLEGKGLGPCKNMTEFIYALQRSNRWLQKINSSGSFQATTKNLPPRKDWAVRFENRFNKAQELVKKERPAQYIPSVYHAGNLSDTHAKLGFGYGGTYYLVFNDRCDNGQCMCHEYTTTSSAMYCNSIFKFYYDADTRNGDMSVEFTAKGMKLLDKLKITGVNKKTIVGNLEDKDAVDIIKTTLLGLHNLLGGVQVH